MLNEYKNTALDSLKLRIFSEDVEMKEKGILAIEHTFKMISTITGEEEEDYKRTSYLVKELEEKGISLRFKYEEVTIDKQKIKKNLVILLNSKLLKSDYLQGITLENIKFIYDEIMKLDYFHIDYKTFINSRITDVDIKSDVKTDSKDLKEDLKFIDSNLVNGELTLSKMNKGLQFGYRQRNNKFISNPFIKFYSKKLELLNNSKTFYDNFLQEQNVNFLRLEGTIKNNKHFTSILKSLKQKKRELTLINLLELKESDKISILRLFLSKYNKLTNRIVKIDLEENKMTNDELMMYLALKLFITSGGNVNEWIENLRINFPKTTFHKKKKDVVKVYELLKKDKEVSSKIYRNNWINDLLNFRVA